ncbi:MAG: transcriptional regulator [Steroidobacteraceae bacterium]
MPLPEALANFDKLPDDAIVLDPVAAKILGVSIWTLRRNNPVPARQISERRRGRRAGDLRKLIRGELQPAA